MTGFTGPSQLSVVEGCGLFGASNGGTEAINGVIEKARWLAHGSRNFTNYRIRILLAADGTSSYRRLPAVSPEPR